MPAKKGAPKLTAPSVVNCHVLPVFALFVSDGGLYMSFARCGLFLRTPLRQQLHGFVTA
jgi:hypothetical protein